MLLYLTAPYRITPNTTSKTTHLSQKSILAGALGLVGGCPAGVAASRRATNEMEVARFSDVSE
jgi:hypothetical protein